MRIAVGVILGLSSLAVVAEPLKVCFISGSFEYDSDTALTIFQEYLESGYEVEVTMLSATDWDTIPGLDALDACDVTLLYTRRLTVDGEDLERIKEHVRTKPIVAVRTASHGFQHDLAFDAEVLGGNYRGHFGEGPAQEVRWMPAGREHPILEGVGPMRSQESLYRTEPIAEDATLLLRSVTHQDGAQPLAWTRERDGQRVFYTSLGGIGDFEGASFRRKVANALFWAAGREPVRKPLPAITERTRPEGEFVFPVRTRTQGADGEWVEGSEVITLPIAKTAILICDMWDKHWCRYASDRVDEMAPRMDAVIRAARDAGMLIVHAPSSTMGFYQDSIPRRRAQAAPTVEPPPALDISDPPLPIDDSDEGCPDDDQQYSAWSRQHAAIGIEDVDGLSDDGGEVFNLFAQEGIEHIIYMGVHTNMCILNRSFAIRQMTRWGKECYLVRDMTDSMYNPAMPPFVSRDEGTELVVQHIEKYWGPSLVSEDLVSGLPAR